MSDRRRSARSPSFVEMQIATQGGWQRVWIVDVSSHGVRFLGVNAPPAGTRIRIALRAAGHVLHLTGSIVWNEKHRVAAVDFDPMLPCQRVMLRALLLEVESLEPARGSVLVMVDDPANVAAIGIPLRKWGYRSIVRVTALEAIHSVVTGPPRAAIVSPTLAGDTGLTVLEFLADEYPAVHRGLLVGPGYGGPLRAAQSVLTAPLRESQLAAFVTGPELRRVEARCVAG